MPPGRRSRARWSSPRGGSPSASSPRRWSTGRRCSRSTGPSTSAWCWCGTWPSGTRWRWSTPSTRCGSRGRRRSPSRSSRPSARPPTSTASRSATPAISPPPGWATPRRPSGGRRCSGSRPPGRRRWSTAMRSSGRPPSPAPSGSAARPRPRAPAGRSPSRAGGWPRSPTARSWPPTGCWPARRVCSWRWPRPPRWPASSTPAWSAAAGSSAPSPATASKIPTGPSPAPPNPPASRPTPKPPRPPSPSADLHPAAAPHPRSPVPNLVACCKHLWHGGRRAHFDPPPEHGDRPGPGGRAARRGPAAQGAAPARASRARDDVRPAPGAGQRLPAGVGAGHLHGAGRLDGQPACPQPRGRGLPGQDRRSRGPAGVPRPDDTQGAGGPGPGHAGPGGGGGPCHRRLARRRPGDPCHAHDQAGRQSRPAAHRPGDQMTTPPADTPSTAAAAGAAATDQDQLPEPGMQPSYLSHRQILIVLCGVMAGMLLFALDQGIVGTALPRIVSELGGLNQLSWVVTAYLLTSTASTPLWGKISDLYGRRRIFQVAIVIFLIGSALCGLSQNMEQLILFRALQGVGGGGLFAIALATIGDIVPPREGGWFTDGPGWRWIFYINIPIGIAALAIISYALKIPLRKREAKIDYVGAA